MCIFCMIANHEINFDKDQTEYEVDLDKDESELDIKVTAEDNLSITEVLGNEGLETLSTYIYADARKGGLTPELRPLSTIIFATVLLLLVVINIRAERNRKKEEMK